jgi:hypothetical protein
LSAKCRKHERRGRGQTKNTHESPLPPFARPDARNPSNAMITQALPLLSGDLRSR